MIPVEGDHRTTFEQMTPEDWARWKHHPITAAYLKFLEDSLGNWRVAAADIVLGGHFDPSSTNASLNPHVVRGRMLTFEELIELKVEVIQEFYREEREERQTL